jgi:hypothetical protein
MSEFISRQYDFSPNTVWVLRSNRRRRVRVVKLTGVEISIALLAKNGIKRPRATSQLELNVFLRSYRPAEN